MQITDLWEGSCVLLTGFGVLYSILLVAHCISVRIMADRDNSKFTRYIRRFWVMFIQGYPWFISVVEMELCNIPWFAIESVFSFWEKNQLHGG